MSKLLPSNRKVRHLHGISLRNLALLKPSRRRGHTIDDEQIPTTLSSPAKLIAQREGRLGHSQSFSDLKGSAIDEENVDGFVNGNTANGSPSKAKSKRRQPLRRRSTLTWSHESPENRQRLLQDAVAERRVDSFFSLHHPEEKSHDGQPTYISEVKQKSMNVDFQRFDLSETRDVSRLDRIIVKVWAAKSGGDFSQLIDADIELPALVWLGKTLEDFELPFSDNAIIFHMADGVYTLMDYLPNIQSFLSSNLAQPSTPRTAGLPPENTSSFDALMKLKDLAEIIDDAVMTRQTVSNQIEAIIQENKARSDALEAAVLQQAAAETAKQTSEHELSEVKKLRNDLDRRQRTLHDRRAVIKEHHSAQASIQSQLDAERLAMYKKRTSQDEARTAHSGQLRRIAGELLDALPIEPIEGHFLCFTICGLYLPNAKAFEDETTYKGPPINSEATAAALGFVAQIVTQLELYLGIPIPYEPRLYGSSSTIFDPLSSAKELGLGSASGSIIGGSKSLTTEHSLSAPTPETHPFRLFPLYQYGSQPKRFRWAIYLLNKDIEELMQHSGCKVMDPRTTLANLKYLLSVLASGKGEAPGRKVGIVKGLHSID